MNSKYIVLVVLTFCTYTIQCQTFNNFEADFTIKEKYKLAQKSHLFKGSVNVNSIDQTSYFTLSFPNREMWLLKDSLLTQIVNDSVILSINVGQFENFSLIKEVNSAIKKDYGLSEIGFTQKHTTADSSGVKVEWMPPTVMKEIFLMAITHISDNLLRSVSLFDTKQTLVSSTYFEDYLFIKNIPIPTKIMSKIVGDNEIIFKSLEFRNIKIN